MNISTFDRDDSRLQLCLLTYFVQVYLYVYILGDVTYLSLLREYSNVINRRKKKSFTQKVYAVPVISMLSISTSTNELGYQRALEITHVQIP